MEWMTLKDGTQVEVWDHCREGDFQEGDFSVNKAETIEVPVLGEISVRGMDITKRFSFDAAHQLVNRPWTICGASKHGHHYVMDVQMFGALDSYRLVVDFLDIKPLVNENLIVPFLDHHDLNETVEPICPTVEFLADWVAERLGKLLPTAQGVILKHLRIYETETGWVDINSFTDSDMLYLAGFFDGEGCISQSGGAELQMRIANTDLEVLQHFQRRIGGSIQKSNSTFNSTRQCYSLVLPHGRTRGVAAALFPYCRLKQKRRVLAVAATFPRLETGNLPATDEQIQKIVDHLNSVSLINHPNEKPPHTIETWKVAKDRFRENRRASAARQHPNQP